MDIPEETNCCVGYFDFNSFVTENECEPRVCGRIFNGEPVLDTVDCSRFFYQFTTHYLGKIEDFHGCIVFFVKQGLKGIYLISALLFHKCAVSRGREETPSSIKKQAMLLVEPLLQKLVNHFFSEADPKPFSTDSIFKMIQRDVFDVFSHSNGLFPHTSFKASSNKSSGSSASTFGAEEDDGLVQISLRTDTYVAYAHPFFLLFFKDLFY